MKIYLLRHGSYTPAFIDRGEGLTKKGQKEALAAGDFLASLNDNITYVYASPILRTFQTGELIAHLLKIPLEATPSLAPGGDIPSLFNQIEERQGDCLLVSHAPIIKKISMQFSLELDGIGIASLFCLAGRDFLYHLEWVRSFYIK